MNVISNWTSTARRLTVAAWTTITRKKWASAWETMTMSNTFVPWRIRQERKRRALILEKAKTSLVLVFVFVPWLAILATIYSL